MNSKNILVLLSFLFSFSVFAKTWNVQISGMTCGGCAKTITGELKKYPAVKTVDISVEKGQGTIVSDDAVAVAFGEEQIRSAIGKAGYKAGSISATK